MSPEHPTAAFNPFVERSLRLIASGMGVAYHELGNDLAGVNYSSGRLGVLEERDYFMELQNLMVDAICRPVYEDWIKAALLNGALDLPFDPERYTDVEAYEFIPRRWPWVDPLKDSQASTLDVQNGFSTDVRRYSTNTGKTGAPCTSRLRPSGNLRTSLESSSGRISAPMR